MTDFLVVDHGSIVSILPASAAAREWLDVNITAPVAGGRSSISFRRNHRAPSRRVREGASACLPPVGRRHSMKYRTIAGDLPERITAAAKRGVTTSMTAVFSLTEAPMPTIRATTDATAAYSAPRRCC